MDEKFADELRRQKEEEANQFLNTYFPDFVVLEPAFEKLKIYFRSLKVNEIERCKRVYQINKLARETLSSSIIDAKSMTDLINKIERPNTTKTIRNVKSFKDILEADEEQVNFTLLKNEYLYNNSVIYVDSFRDFPEITFDHNYSEAAINFHDSKVIFPQSKEKVKVYLKHYERIRHFLFKYFQLIGEEFNFKTINNLEGNPNEMNIIGVLIYSEKDKIIIQDPTKYVTIDTTNASIGEGYFTEGCIVLAKGRYKNDCFVAETLIHPCIMKFLRTFKEKYDTDFFGAISKAFRTNKHSNDINQIAMQKSLNPNEKNEKLFENLFRKDLSTKKLLFPKLQENRIIIQSENDNGKHYSVSEEFLGSEYIIIISNPDLTNKNVLLALERLFVGYQNPIPFMVIFIGNFIPESSFNTFTSFSSIFDNLANLIYERNKEMAKHTYIVIMPGPNDMNITSAFPKKPITENIISGMKKKLNLVFSVTNPSRFTMFGKECVFFRDNLNKKLSRYSLINSDSNDNNVSNLVYTILAQGSLAPVNLSLTSKIWDYSSSMLIHPLPDFLCLADLTMDFIKVTEKTVVFNPGNFSKDYSFCVLTPLRGDIQPSKINLN